LEKYINQKYRNNPVIKRRLWLSSSDSDSYHEGKSLFDDLKKLAENKEIVAFDSNYYNNL
jgi:hypothetical protein